MEGPFRFVSVLAKLINYNVLLPTVQAMNGLKGNKMSPQNVRIVGGAAVEGTATFAAFFGVYQIIKRELIYFNGENSPYVGGGMCTASLLPFLAMKSLRAGLPPVLMLVGM